MQFCDSAGGNVIIVIGGDDNYKESEEDREFISRWAKRKISSQFSEECLDGRKSFIFSWDKKHREIHEKALLHHFDPSQKGQKFQYQPPERKRSSKAVTPPAVRKPMSPPGLYRSLTLPEEQSKQLKYESKLPSSPKSPLHNDQAVNGQRSDEIGPCSKPYSQAETRREDVNVYNFDTTSANATPVYSNQGARPKEMLPPSLERPKAKGKNSICIFWHQRICYLTGSITILVLAQRCFNKYVKHKDGGRETRKTVLNKNF